ncbi:unnamed protein product [Cylindrotheca closterium]|uniref:PARP-type domain-containing protein n=1 Tax=Cylindrotheca closterium TaxID=2856 RepID=A0AAD2FS43_9STRA|nr:unnamed protein product [Cylindrotheca closterium]
MTVKTQAKQNNNKNKNKKNMKADAKTAKPKLKSPIVPHQNKNKLVARSKKTWNDMSHLFLKRFADNDATLTAGAKRDRLKHPHLVVAEYDPSGRSKCKLCGNKIAKKDLRFTLFLECHKGYRNACTLHQDCFWKHPETAKLEYHDHESSYSNHNNHNNNNNNTSTRGEIHMAASLSQESRAWIAKTFQDRNTSKKNNNSKPP